MKQKASGEDGAWEVEVEGDTNLEKLLGLRQFFDLEVGFA